MKGATNSVKAVLADFPSPKITNTGRKTTREALIDLHQLLSGSSVSVELNLGGVRHIHLALTMTGKAYMEPTG